MKKHTLKRYLASLLAVLMLISVAGVSPAVFADDTTPPQLVETSANSPKEVLIKSTYSNEQVLNALAAALFTGADNDYAQTLNWTYKWAVKGKYKTSKYDPLEHDTNDAREATVSIFGETQTAKYYYTKRLHADATYTYPALKDQADGSYTLYLNGQTVYIKKVAKLTSSVSVANSSIDVALPYNADGSVNADLLHKLIFDAAGVTTTPEGLTYSDLSYSGDFSEGSNKTVTISYAGNDDYYGSSAPVTVNFTDSRAVAFTAKEKPETLSIGYVGNTMDVKTTENNVRKQLVNVVAEDVSIDQVKVEFRNTANIFNKEDYQDLNLLAIGTYTLAETDIRLSYAGDATHKPFNALFEDIKFADNRVDCKIVIKEGAAITYNMYADNTPDGNMSKEYTAANNMKQQIFDNAIDWENSALPAKETLTIDDFTIEYETLPSNFENTSTDIETLQKLIETTRAYVNIKGEFKGITLFGTEIGLTYPQMGAGEQKIRITFNGDSEYKPGSSDGALTVNKADVKLSVKSFTSIYAAESLPDDFVTLDPNDPAIDIYTFFVGINTNLETAVYIDLPDSKTKLIDAISDAQVKFLGTEEKDTIRGKLNEGVTVGELKKVMNDIVTYAYATKDPVTKWLVNYMLKDYGITVDNLKDLADTLDNLTKIADNLRIALGTPNHAGLYYAFAIAVNDNYNPAYGSGTVLVLMNWKGIKLEKNSVFEDGSTITVSQAEELAKGNNLCILTKDGEPLNDAAAGSVHYWFTGLSRIYAKSAMPTETGKYIVTATVRGGDFFAMPKTFVFTIVADPVETPET